ncbi:unnamed protein product [Linum tenue]|uniref:Uncharacterized protein n=1 Tax=Linum tenue TaxID=586396 RepID=A0AAV0PR81_9ROSI|nr:unnamed protein product [Linum tenue]
MASVSYYGVEFRRPNLGNLYVGPSNNM